MDTENTNLPSPEERYKIILTGKLLPGKDQDEVIRNLATIFKMTIADINQKISGKTVVVKSGIDLPTANKYKTALEKAGAECKTVPYKSSNIAADRSSEDKSMPKTTTETDPPDNDLSPKKSQDTIKTDSPPAEPKASEEKEAQTNEPSAETGMHRVISPPQKPVMLQFTPYPCRTLTGSEGGLNFNRYNNEQVTFSDILLIAVYNLPGIKSITHLLIYIKSQKKPLVVNADAIQYEDFPECKEEDVFVSLRNFIAMLLKQNPSIIMNAQTDAFFAGGEPEVLKREESLIASSLGAALDSEELFELKVHEALQNKANKKEGPSYTEADCYPFFIGPNTDKYIKKFKSFSAGKDNFQATWHWPAFFVPFFWLLYRKLYIHALVVFLISLIPFAGILVSIAMGLSAYYIYYKYSKSSISDVLKYSNSPDIPSKLAEDGSVKPAAVWIGVGGVLFLAIVAAIIGIIGLSAEKIATKQENIMTSPLQFPMPQGQLPNGMQMPQTPDQAMQLAYDNMAMAELRRACTSAQIVFSEGNVPFVTMPDLERSGFRPRSGVQINIINPNMDSLAMSSRHSQGSKTFYIDRDCVIKEQGP